MANPSSSRMTQSMRSVEFDVCFVQNSDSVDGATESLKLAFESMDANDLEPAWVTQETCRNVRKKEAKLYVMDPFEGEIYEHLVKLQCRIVGPYCILSCLHLNDTLPKRPHPVYSVSMRRMSVSCSNVDEASRKDISKKIELMGGIFSKDLTKSVTHLIVGAVGSKKYHVAANFGLKIMKPEWVKYVWENQSRELHANDTYFDKYKCPIFYGLVICVSQLSTEERQALKSIIEKNGGKYSGALKVRETTHLVLSERTGEKYRFAKSWKVLCIKVNWIYDSIEYGYCRDENLYPLDASQPSPKRSTPEKDKSMVVPMVDCSAISSNSLISHLDETTRTEILAPTVAKSSAFSALETFNVSSLPKSGQFLDGCKIFLTGFSNMQMEKLRKIVNAGGGMRFRQYSDSITHVVSGELSDELLESIKSSSVKPHVVNFNWLLECCRSEKMVDENPFLCLELDGLSPHKVVPCESVNNVTVNESTRDKFNLSSQTDGMNQENITDIFKQYINENKSKIETENNCLAITDQTKDASMDKVSKDSQSCDKVDVDFNEDSVFEEDASSSQQLFKRKTFAIHGFAEKDSEILSIMIETHKGKVLPLDSEQSSDIAIVPLIWSNFSLNSKNIVTNCWLQKCIEEGRIFSFDDNELFKPLDIQLNLKPFESFVISVSQYCGTERDCLMHLAEVLGAKCQEYFVRKANKSKGVFTNTHLVVCTPDGSKYEAAKKWKIPAVTKYWLFEAATSGKVPPVEDFLVENAPPPLNNAECLKENEPIAKAEKSFQNGAAEVLREQSQENQNTPKGVDVRSKSSSHKDLSLSTPVLKSVSDFTDCKKPSSQKRKLDISLNKSLGAPSDLRFNVSGLLNDLDSCSSQEGFDIKKKTSSPSLAKLFNQSLSAAIDNVKVLSKMSNKRKLLETENETTDENGLLSGVVIYVAKKLASLQIELNEIVTSLGGHYLWSYDSTCTHYVFQGKQNDLTKEFREARNQGKFIVAPEWLYACHNENEHVSEASYPHTFKTRMSLGDQISTSKISDGNKEAFTSSKNKEKDLPCAEEKIAEAETDPVDFNKELNELLEAAKSAKRSYPKRLASSGSNSNSPVNDQIASSVKTRHASNAQSNIFNRKPSEDVPEEADDHNTQPSQTYPIAWDDLTGRLEREKIAAKLASSKSVHLSTKKEETYEREVICRSNEVTASDVAPHKRKVRRFMFTGFSDNERAKYAASVKSLGGEVSEDKAFDLSATHLVLDKPLKNEKFLASVASGKLILHSSYVTACVENGAFLPEEMYEWGGVSTNKFLRDPSRSTLSVANCPHRWRTTIQQDVTMLGAFHGWRVLIYADDRVKHDTFANILKSGGAKIVPYPTPESILSEVTHVFVDSKKKPLQIDLTQYVSNNANCLKPEYLAFYLINDPPPPVDDYILPDVRDASLSLKKRNLSSASKGSKRTRLK